MSTKNNPGAFRCFEAALPDEPIFTILGRDPAAPATLRFWADERARLGKTETADDLDRMSDANRDANLMLRWRVENANVGPNGESAWHLVKITDEDGGPICLPPENVQYVPAERDGDEAVRVSGEWLLRTVESLRNGAINREAFAELMVLTCAAPCRERKIGKDPVLGMGYQPDPKAKVAVGLQQVADDLTVFVEGRVQQPELHAAARLLLSFADRLNGYAAELTGVNSGNAETKGERVMIDTHPDDLAHAPEVPPHRFSQFHKGERYAYARGLEINPVHLPVALDAMAADGWHLLSIFGATDSKNVGFIFERFVPIGPLDDFTQGRTLGEIYHPLDGGPSLDKVYQPRDGGRDSPEFQRYMAGESFEDLTRDGPAVSPAQTEDQGGVYVIEYAQRLPNGDCQIVRSPAVDWPEWTQPCSGMGRGMMP